MPPKKKQPEAQALTKAELMAQADQANEALAGAVAEAAAALNANTDTN